ncbi:MAG TPA: sulfite exporter TauE/SafE family protein [Steroidobacteraceae bacterium]
MSTVLGLVVGLILGLTGAGGSILAVPLLIFALNWSVARSAPVALIAVAASAALGTAIGLRQGIVRYRAAMAMAAAGAIVAPGGLFLAHRLPAAPLQLLFALVLLIVAWRMYRHACSSNSIADVRSPARSVPCQIDPATGRFAWTAPCTRALVIAGSVTGLLSGLLGVGGGFVVVPALQRATALSMNAIVATSLAVVALVSTFAVTAAAVTGHLDIDVAIPFAIGALVGMAVGRVIAPRVAGSRLQQGFAMLCALVAIGLIAKTMRGH